MLQQLFNNIWTDVMDVIVSTMKFNQMLMLAPMACTQEDAILHTSRQPDPSTQNQNKHFF